MLRAAATMRGAGSAVLHGRPPRAGSGLIDAVHGPPRPGYGLLHGIHGRPQRAGSGLIDAVHGRPQRAGSGLIDAVHGPPRPGSGLLHGVHGPPRAGSGLLHGVLAGLRGPTHPRAGAAAVLYNSTGLGASGAYLKGVRGLPRAGAPYTLLNGVHGYSRAEYAGCTLALFTRQRCFHSKAKPYFDNKRYCNLNNKRCFQSKAKRYFDRKRYYNFNTKRSFHSKAKRYFDRKRENMKAAIQTMWRCFQGFVKNAPVTVRAKLSHLVQVIKTSPGAIQVKWISVLQSMKSAQAIVRGHWLYQLLYRLYASLIKGCLFFDCQYKRAVAYFPLAASLSVCLYLDLAPIEYFDFLNYICVEKCKELAHGYAMYWLIRMDAASKKMKVEPRDENKMDSAVESAHVALKQAQTALKEAERALESVVKTAAEAEKAAAAAAAAEKIAAGEKIAAAEKAAAAAEKAAAAAEKLLSEMTSAAAAE